MFCACGSAPAVAGDGSAAHSNSAAVGPGNTSAGASATTSPAGPSGAAASGAALGHPGGAGSAPAAPAPAHMAASGVLAAAGTYTYDLSGSSSGSDTVAVANQQPSGSTTGQTITVTDNGNQVTSYDSWSPASVLIKEVTTKTSKGSADCRLSTAIIEEQFPLSTGATWHSDATCPVSQGALSGTLHWTESDTVSGSTTVTVDGTAVACWIITRQITIQLEGASGAPASPGSTSGSGTQVDDYAPDLGLPARTTVMSKGSSRTLTLQHLHPS